MSAGGVLLAPLFQLMADASGLPGDQVRFLACMLLSYPIALAFSTLLAPAPASSLRQDQSTIEARAQVRHLVNAAIGFWLAVEFMSWGVLHSLFSATVTYVIANALPREVQHKVVFAWAMAYMSGVHIYRMYTGYLLYVVDFSGPQMMLTIKMITFAFDLRDGAVDASTGGPGKKPLTPHQKEMKLDAMPGVVEYFGYVFAFCGYLAGPAVNMKEYLQWADGSLFASAPGGVMPSPIVAGVKRFGVAVVAAVVMQLAGTYLPLDYAWDPEFATQPLWWRIFYFWFACALCRQSYYFAWNLSEGSCDWAGLGFQRWNPTTKSAEWTRARNVEIVNIETAQNYKGITDNWNIRTDHWLKNYVYLRVPPAYGVFLTMFCSALWHGFYPGYYLSFLTAGFNVTLARKFRRTFRSLFITWSADGRESPKPTKPIYDVISFIVTSASLNYTMGAFTLLGWERALTAWTNVYFWKHGAIVLAFAVMALPIKWPRPPRPATSAASAAASPRSNRSKKD